MAHIMQFMSLNTIRSLGFASLRDARDTYYRRAKVCKDGNSPNRILHQKRS